MKSQFLINKETQEIINTIVIRKKSDYKLDDDHELIEPNDQNIGDTYDKNYVLIPPVPTVPTYQELRKAEYPEIGEQLDAILKGFNQLRLDGTNLPSDLDEIVAQWLNVKKKYPKNKLT